MAAGYFYQTETYTRKKYRMAIQDKPSLDVTPLTLTELISVHKLMF